MLEDLGEDHVAWLLVAANNYLGQQRADRATVLLELLGLLDPANLQARKMLAYAHWLEGDWPRCAEIIDSVLEQPLGDEDRAAMEWMKLRLGDTAPDPHAANRPTGRA